MSEPLEPTEPTPAADPDGATSPTAPDPTPAADPAQEPTDWKAMARKWEKLAKQNSSAADELDKVKKASMTETEKAVAAAKAEGRTEAAREHGKQLAEAKFEAALASKGLKLDDFRDLIDFAKFVTDKGETDADAIKKAVDKLAKVTTKTPGRSGADFTGGTGHTPATLDQQIADAEKAGNHRLAIRLKRQRAALTTQ